MIFTLNPIRKYIFSHPKILAFISGLLCALAQAPLFYLWGLVALSILVYLIYDSPSLKEAIKRNIAFSLGYFGYGFYWTTIAISFYIEDFWWMIPISLIGLPLIFCFFTSLAATCAWHFRNHPHYIMIYTIFWVFIEWLTSWIFTGLPWMLIGYSVGFSDILSQFASVAGVLGISFVLFNIAGTFYYIWGFEAKLRRVDIVYSAIVLVIIYIFGLWRLNEYPIELTDTRIRIVQPSIPLKQKWDIDAFWANLDLHSKLSTIRTPVKPDIILWSEASIAAPYKIEPVFNYLSHLARKSDAILISGAVSTLDKKHYTSLIAIGNDGDLLFEYNKIHLVPFGEYIPLRTIFPSTIKKLTYGLEDYTPGLNSQKIFFIDKLKIKIRPMICYESLFAEEVKINDADLLINITNSSWFGNSSAPYHLFYINKFRAIENSTPVVVSANSGISGIFDSVGRVIAKTSLNDITTLDMYTPQKISASTAYSRTGLNTLLMIMVFLHCLRIILNKIA